MTPDEQARALYEKLDEMAGAVGDRVPDKEEIIQVISTALRATRPIWTDARPTEPGWYWFKKVYTNGVLGPMVLEVNDNGCAHVIDRWEKIGDKLGEIHGQWARIEMPEDDIRQREGA